jgi:hypothetical protein
MKWGALIIPADPMIFWGGLAVAILFAIGVTYLSLRRANRKRLLARLLVNYAAIGSLLATALQPQWLSPSHPLSAVLITPGADSRDVKSLADSLGEASRIFALEKNEKWKAAFPNLQIIPDAAYLKRRFPEINFLEMVGYGLTDDEWRELDSIQIKPHFSPLPLGIKQAHWTRELVLGQALQIQGVLAGLNREDYQLFLSDPGGAVDSVKITGPDEARFALSASPHETGNYLYRLRLKNVGGVTVCEEQIDVVVTKPQPLKILALESSVNFETKFLKNWAAQNQNAVAMRSTISRERYRFEYLNHPPIDLQRISPALLRNFDVALMDGKILRALSQGERQALRAAIELEGLGLLLIPDEMILPPALENFSQRDFFLGFDFEAFTEIDRRLIKPRWPNIRSRDLTAIPAEPFAIRRNWGLLPLIEDEMERVVAGAYHRGEGLIGLSLMRDSYRWILEGHANYHAAYWSYLLTTLSRQRQDQDRWSIPNTNPLIVDQPLDLTVETTAALPVGLVKTETGEPDSIYLQQDVTEPRRWFGRFWPREAGWHQVSIVGGASHWFYVYERTNWQSRQAAQKINATQRQVVRYANQPERKRQFVAPQARPISLFWFFAVFVLSAAYLWVERKFSP